MLLAAEQASVTQQAGSVSAFIFVVVIWLIVIFLIIRAVIKHKSYKKQMLETQQQILQELRKDKG